jgi:hypothetical protein
MKNQSIFLQFVLLIWDNNPGKSWTRFNHALYSATKTAIEAKLPIEDGDFDYIMKKCRFSYWAGTSTNGHHCGEGLYQNACQNYPKAAINFENATGRIPFILNGKRLYDGSRIIIERIAWRITGWSKENNTILLVSDSPGTNMRMQYTPSEWKIARKEITHC